MAAVFIVAAILLFLVQGCAEEAVLRGYLMQSVAAKWGIPAGLAIQAVVFTALHGANPGTTWVALVNVTGFGLMQGLLVVWRGNQFQTVWKPIAASRLPRHTTSRPCMRPNPVTLTNATHVVPGLAP